MSKRFRNRRRDHGARVEAEIVEPDPIGEGKSGSQLPLKGQYSEVGGATT